MESLPVRLGLTNEWIEIVSFLDPALAGEVSVLRPSGLKWLMAVVILIAVFVSVLRPSGLKY